MVAVSDNNLYIGTDKVHYRIERLYGHILFEQIEQTISGVEFFAVIHDSQTGIKECIILQHRLDKLIAEFEILEQCVIRQKFDVCTVRFFGWIDIRLFEYLAALILDSLSLTATECGDGKRSGKGVGGFDTDTVKADRLLERRRVILTAGVHLGRHIANLVQRNTATVVAYLNLPFFTDIDIYLLAAAHGKLIDRVIEHLFQNDIYTVIGMSAVAQLTDIHTRTLADMLFPIKRLDIVVNIVCSQL